MVISSKGEYALRVMADLAINHDGRFIPLKEIVQKLWNLPIGTS